MFNAICVSTGKSAKATLNHCALHPVAINATLSRMANRILVLEFLFMKRSPCKNKLCGFATSESGVHVQKKTPPIEAGGAVLSKVFDYFSVATRYRTLTKSCSFFA